MASAEHLTSRQLHVLEAVIQTYIETAEPAGSRTVSQRFGLGVSSATVRNIMSELEDQGLLYHPHTSAGRIPTDLAYRVYVDSLMQHLSIERRSATDPAGRAPRLPQRDGPAAPADGAGAWAC